jgi:hypothetical protein
VTRLKDNAAYEVLSDAALPQKRNIISDQSIQLTGGKARQDCPFPLRRVVVWNPLNNREIVLLTNHPDFGATTIAAIYKDRWEIELFFKAPKQNLNAPGATSSDARSTAPRGAVKRRSRRILSPHPPRPAP